MALEELEAAGDRMRARGLAPEGARDLWAQLAVPAELLVPGRGAPSARARDGRACTRASRPCRARGSTVGDGTELRLAIGRRSSAAAIVDQRRWMRPRAGARRGCRRPEARPVRRRRRRPNRAYSRSSAPHRSGRARARSPPNPRDRASHSSMDRAGRWRRLGVVHAQHDGPFQVEPSGRPPARQQRQPQDGAQLRRRGTSAGSRPQTSAGSRRSRRRATTGAPSRVAHTASPVTWRAATTTSSSQARDSPGPTHSSVRPRTERPRPVLESTVPSAFAASVRLPPESPHPSRRL